MFCQAAENWSNKSGRKGFCETRPVRTHLRSFLVALHIVVQYQKLVGKNEILKMKAIVKKQWSQTKSQYSENFIFLLQ